jgi:G:T-mismatch repair DNA endonuclease (very short patch repair protein)
MKHTQFWLKHLKENVCFEYKRRLEVLKEIRWEVVLGFI